MCPRTTKYVLLYMCPRTTTGPRITICVLVLLHSSLRAPGACCRSSPCRQHTSACVRMRPHTSAYASIRQHTSTRTCELQALVAVVVLVVDHCLVVHRLDDPADHQRDVDGLGAEVVANYRHVRDHHSRQLLACLVGLVVRGAPLEERVASVFVRSHEQPRQYWYSCTSQPGISSA